MDSSFTILLPDAPELIVGRLEAFGREWRESKLPESIRTRGYTTSDVTRRGESIIITLGPTGRGPAYVLETRVVASGAGSQLHAEVREARWSRAVISAFLALAALAFIWETLSDRDSGQSSWLPLAAMIGLMIGARAVLVRAGQAKMITTFRELVEHALRRGQAAA